MYDLIIIGMGPAGMSAAIYAKNAGLNFIILESDAPGGTILKAKNINNYLGFENISGSELAYKMFSHVNNLNIKYSIEQVLKIDELLNVVTNKNTYKTKSILITSGKGINKLIINGKNIQGYNLSFCVLCDASIYKDKNVVLITDETHNVEYEKQYLKKIVNNIEVINIKKIKEIKEEKNIITTIVTEDGDINNIDGVFVSGLDNTIVEFDKNMINRINGKITVNEKYETNVKGIYAAGDVVNKDFYQICNAVGEGAVAVSNIVAYLNEL